MKKSTRALLGMLVLDLLLAFGALWLAMQVKTGAWATNVPPEESISTVTSIAGGAIGIVTAVLLMAWCIGASGRDEVAAIPLATLRARHRIMLVRPPLK